MREQLQADIERGTWHIDQMRDLATWYTRGADRFVYESFKIHHDAVNIVWGRVTVAELHHISTSQLQAAVWALTRLHVQHADMLMSIRKQGHILTGLSTYQSLFQREVNRRVYGGPVMGGVL